METIESMEPEILDESAESCETCCGLSRQTWGWALVGSGALTALSLLLVMPLLLGVPSLVALLGTRAVIERIETFGVHERDE